LKEQVEWTAILLFELPQATGKSCSQLGLLQTAENGLSFGSQIVGKWPAVGISLHSGKIIFYFY